MSHALHEQRKQPRREIPPWLTGIMLLATLGAFVLAPNPEALAWSVTALEDGQAWRLLTGHWIHSDRLHLGWNGLALAVLGTFIERHGRGLLIGSLVAGHLAVTGWLMTPWAGLERYCGLSGVLHALLVTALILEWRHGSRKVAFVAAALSLAKLGVELLSGTAMLTQTRWPSVPSAHASGVLGGLLLGLIRVLPAYRLGSKSLSRRIREAMQR